MRRLTGHLYFWVLLAILAGGIFGYVNPPAAVKLKPLGDGFIALVKMLIGPVIFCTVVLGIVGAGDMRKVGRVGGKALIYFEIVSSIALVIGLAVVGCTSDPKYDEPPKSEATNAPTNPSQPSSGAPPGQFGFRSDKADDPK